MQYYNIYLIVTGSDRAGDDVDPESLLPPDKRQKLNSLYDSGKSGTMRSRDGPSGNSERNRNNDSYYDLVEDEFDLSALGSIPRREKAVGLKVVDDSIDEDVDGGEIDEARTWLKQCTQQVDDEEEVYSELEDDEDDVAVLKYQGTEIGHGLDNDVEGVEGAFVNGVAHVGKLKDDLDGLLEESETISVRFMDKSKNELSVLATVNDTFEYPFGKFKDHAISKVMVGVVLS